MVDVYSVTPGAMDGDYPVSIDLAKANAGYAVEPSAEDELFRLWVGAACKLAEETAHHRIVPRVVTVRFGYFPESREPLVFPFSPVRKLDSVTYLPAAGGAAVALDPLAGDFFPWLEYDPPHLWAGVNGWPSIAAPSFVTAILRVGYKAPDLPPELMPETLRLAVLGLTAFFERNRDFVGRGGELKIPPAFRSAVMSAARGGIY